MRFLMIYHPTPTAMSAPPPPKLMAEMGAFIEESTMNGALIATGGIAPGTTPTRVRSAGGKLTVMDGPYAESKELVGGFALVEARSKEEAVAYAQRFLRIVGDGESEIHALAGAPPAE
jgi:hypothetical protein